MRSGEGQGGTAQTLSAAIAELSKACTDKGVQCASCNARGAIYLSLRLGVAYEEREITSDCMGVCWDITSQGIKGSRKQRAGGLSFVFLIVTTTWYTEYS